MKANATHSGPAAARNTFSSLDITPGMDQAGPVHPGLVSHPALSTSAQVQILSVVDVTGSASIGDIIAELPGHPDPVAAIFALIAAAVLEVRTRGIIDAHTIVARAGMPDLHPGACAVSTGAVPAGEPEQDSEVTTGLQPIDFAGFAPDALPCDLQAVPTTSLQPRIIVGPGSRRAGFRQVDGLRQPGVYILLRGQDAYVGYGADVAARATAGRQMPGGAPDVIIAIGEDRNRLSDDDARALERILWSRVANDRDFLVLNGVPDGAAIDPERYSQLTLFAAQVALALRQAGLMFLHGSVREQIAGPRAEPERLGAPRRIDDLPDGRVMELSYCGLTAVAAERDDGSWLLLRGSDVRIDTVSSAAASASFQRAAWLHAGLLEPAHDGSCYVLRRDMVFSSGSAVGHFVSGSKGFGLHCWAPIDEDEADPAELAC